MKVKGKHMVLASACCTTYVITWTVFHFNWFQLGCCVFSSIVSGWLLGFLMAMRMMNREIKIFTKVKEGTEQ